MTIEDAMTRINELENKLIGLKEWHDYYKGRSDAADQIFRGVESLHFRAPAAMDAFKDFTPEMSPRLTKPIKFDDKQT